jgi:hypothetical protein
VAKVNKKIFAAMPKSDNFQTSNGFGLGKNFLILPLHLSFSRRDHFRRARQAASCVGGRKNLPSKRKYQKI